MPCETATAPPLPMPRRQCATAEPHQSPRPTGSNNDNKASLPRRQEAPPASKYTTRGSSIRNCWPAIAVPDRADDAAKIATAGLPAEFPICNHAKVSQSEGSSTPRCGLALVRDGGRQIAVAPIRTHQTFGAWTAWPPFLQRAVCCLEL